MSDVARLLQDLRELHPCITVYESVGDGWKCEACGGNTDDDSTHMEGQWAGEFFCLESPLHVSCGTCVDAEENYAKWPCPTGMLIEKWERRLLADPEFKYAVRMEERHCPECEERNRT